MDHLSEQSALDLLRSNLRTYEELLNTARAAAAQLPLLENLVEMTRKQISDIEAGNVVRASTEVQPGEYAKFKLIDAVVAYLEKRTHPTPAIIRTEVTPAMVLGGVIVGKGDRRKPLREATAKHQWRIVRTAISMNQKSKRVIYNEKNDTVELPSPKLL